MMNKIITILITICALLPAAQSHSGRNSSSRAQAVGNAFSSITEDASVLFYNPVAYNGSGESDFFFNYQNVQLSIKKLNQLSGAFSFPLVELNNKVLVSGGVSYRGLIYEALYNEDELMVSLNVDTAAIITKLPEVIDCMVFGIQGGYFSQRYSYNSTVSPAVIALIGENSIGIPLLHVGFLTSLLSKKLNLSFAAKNILSASTIQNLQDTDQIKPTYIVGASGKLKLNTSLEFVPTVDVVMENGLKINGGVETSFNKKIFIGLGATSKPSYNILYLSGGLGTSFEVEKLTALLYLSLSSNPLTGGSLGGIENLAVSMNFKWNPEIKLLKKGN